MNMLKRWRAAEPVRLYLYGVGLAVLAVLVGYGLVEATLAPLWAALVVAVLGVPATEAARGRVEPVQGRHEAEVGDAGV